MKLKHTVLTLSLLTAAAIAASGCSRGVNVIDFAGQEMTAPSKSVTPTDTAGNDTIVPDNTGTTTADSGTTTDTGTTSDPVTPTDPGSGAHEEKYCPAGTASEDGNGTLCCRIDDPQVCMIVDPVPPGGVRPGVLDHLPLDAVITVDPTPPPPDHGGGGGAGGLHDSKTPDCYISDRYGNERRAHQTDTGGTSDLPGRGCTMI
ncbi:MAG TPA: hypothetical protein VFX30_06300 [bacterium]|nr:hypothetical protein [bacterium]